MRYCQSKKNKNDLDYTFYFDKKIKRAKSYEISGKDEYNQLMERYPEVM